MESSTLHDILSTKLYPYYKMLAEQKDSDLAEIEELYADIKKSFTEEQIKLVDKYKHLCFLREEYIEFQMQIRVLNYGIKIGMELQKSFFDYVDD